MNTQIIFNYIWQVALRHVDCKWSQWSQCSAKCGAGIKERHIKVQKQAGGSKCKGGKTMNCNLGPCQGNFPWSYTFT